VGRFIWKGESETKAVFNAYFASRIHFLNVFVCFKEETIFRLKTLISSNTLWLYGIKLFAQNLLSFFPINLSFIICSLLLCQINGNVEAVQEALVQITSRLKHHFLRDKAPPFGPYMGGSGVSPQQHFPSQPPPFHGFGRPYEEGPPYDRRTPWGPPPVYQTNGLERFFIKIFICTLI
jgi:hypothetical protein